LQILQTLAAMLEQPGAERVTTAGLATKIGVSEAACTGTSPARRRCSKA
jgi:TetR/AcrR family transcriptional regulator